MTTGKGVSHTERTPAFQREADYFNIHGYQIWVALPKHKEDVEPHFDFYPSTEIPAWEIGALTIKLIVGNAFGKSTPLHGFSPLFMVDISAEEATTLNLRGQLQGEVAFVIVKGSIIVEDEEVEVGQMLISKTNEQCKNCLGDKTQLLLFGGKELPEEHFLLWNFVSRDKERLKQARQDWKEK